MKYIIENYGFPVLAIELDQDEKIFAESGTFCFANEQINITTKSDGLIKSALLNQTWFKLLISSRDKNGKVYLSRSLPGEIKPIEIKQSQRIVCEKSSLLAFSDGVKVKVRVSNFSTGLFGGEGFVFQELYGDGIAFIQVCGHLYEKELGADERVIVDTGKVVGFSDSCKIEIKKNYSLKTVITSDHGLFNTVIVGPGKVILQSLSISRLANFLSNYVINKN